MNKKTETLNLAVAAFKAETGIEIKVIEREVKLESKQKVDAIVQLRSQPDTTFYAEIKNWVAQAHIGGLVNQMMQLPEPRLLIADYVNKKLAERLKNREIQYIDTAGNAYIKTAQTYINVRGNDRKVHLNTAEHRVEYQLDVDSDTYQVAPGHAKSRANSAIGRAFTAAGLKAVYVLLVDHGAIEATYRYIAEKADVALGTIGWVMNDLKARGLLLERGKKKKIVDYKKLLDLWAEAYLVNLRPKLHIAELYHEDPYWWRDFDIEGVHGEWGGETAAAILTKNIKPTTTTIYLRGGLGLLVNKARLHRQQNATDMKVEILLPFWPEAERAEQGNTVDKHIVYADLINTADPRNIETAQLLLEN